MIAIACDSAGLNIKSEIIAFLNKQGLEYTDFGTYDELPVDYPSFAQKVANSILNGECGKGILICGTGNGISMAANRFHGIRAAICHDTFTAEAARSHNDANIISFGARVITAETALKCLKIFLATPFSGEERHTRRIDMIDKLSGGK